MGRRFETGFGYGMELPPEELAESLRVLPALGGKVQPGVALFEQAHGASAARELLGEGGRPKLEMSWPDQCPDVFGHVKKII